MKRKAKPEADLRAQVSAVLAEARALVQRLEAQELGVPVAVDEAEVELGGRYLATTSKKGELVPVEVVDFVDFRQAGRRMFHLIRTDGTKHQGPPMLRLASELYPPETEISPASTTARRSTIPPPTRTTRRK